MTGYSDRHRFYQGIKNPPVNVDRLIEQVQEKLKERLSKFSQLLSTLAGSTRQNPLNKKYEEKLSDAIARLDALKHLQPDENQQRQHRSL